MRVTTIAYAISVLAVFGVTLFAPRNVLKPRYFVGHVEIRNQKLSILRHVVLVIQAKDNKEANLIFQSYLKYAYDPEYKQDEDSYYVFEIHFEDAPTIKDVPRYGNYKSL